MTAATPVVNAECKVTRVCEASLHFYLQKRIFKLNLRRLPDGMERRTNCGCVKRNINGMPWKLVRRKVKRYWFIDLAIAAAAHAKWCTKICLSLWMPVVLNVNGLTQFYFIYTRSWIWARETCQGTKKERQEVTGCFHDRPKSKIKYLPTQHQFIPPKSDA